MRCSAVIPVFNEAESLQRLHDELRQVAREERIDLELVLIDDGSTDRSWEVIQGLARRDPKLSAIRFRRNFGKAAALSAGFQAAQGEIVFTLDADLQDNPKEMGRFLAMMNQGYDVISGWKAVRHDPWHKTFPSKVFNALVSRLTGVKLHDHNCGFKCYRREVLDEVDLYGEMHRFIPVLASARGFRVGELTVDHRRREHGKSKYGFERFIKGFLDLLTVYFLTSFRQRPQHMLGTIGLVAFALGLAGMGSMAVYWTLREFTTLGADWAPLHQRPIVIYSLGALLLGAQLISMGILAELITANFGRGGTDYSIRERLVAGKASSGGLGAEGDGFRAAVDDPHAGTESESSESWRQQGMDDPTLHDPSGLHERGDQ